MVMILSLLAFMAFEVGKEVSTESISLKKTFLVHIRLL
jgi:hypothetical protein